jgi:hypothetical protein
MATVEHLRNQLVVASDYAASENDSRVPSTWQIQNAHLDAYLGQIERLLEDAAQ